MNIQINLTNPTVEYLQEIFVFLSSNQKLLESVSGTSSSVKVSSTKTYGPLAKEWMRRQNVSRVRCTDGRSTEEQAAHNLKTYFNLSDDELQDILNENEIVSDSSDEDSDDIPIEDADLI